MSKSVFLSRIYHYPLLVSWGVCGLSVDAYADQRFYWTDTSHRYDVSEAVRQQISDMKINEKITLAKINASYKVEDDNPSNIDGAYIKCAGMTLPANLGWEFQLEFGSRLTCAAPWNNWWKDNTNGNHALTLIGNLTLRKTEEVSSNMITLPQAIVGYLHSYYQDPNTNVQRNWWHGKPSNIDVTPTKPACTAMITSNGSPTNALILKTIVVWPGTGAPPTYPGTFFTIQPSLDPGCDSQYYQTAAIELTTTTQEVDGIPVIMSTHSSQPQYGITLKEQSANLYWSTNDKETADFDEDELLSFNVNYYKVQSDASHSKVEAAITFSVIFL